MGAATTIVNAKVFDGTTLQDWTSVRFADGLITKCSPAREGDEVVDAGGGTVLPGLIDAHVHLVPGALAQSLTFGVTTVLDMFSKPALVASAKEQAGSRPDVADVRSSGVGATAPPCSRAEENVRRLADAGITLLAGTDAPNPGTVFGASLHRELELLVRCGISPAQALSAATAEPARVFGLADRGRIAAGQRADLVLVPGDPLTDITATRAIDRIWRAGTACDRRAFVPSAAEAEQLDAFDARLAKAVAAVRSRTEAATRYRRLLPSSDCHRGQGQCRDVVCVVKRPYGCQ